MVKRPPMILTDESNAFAHDTMFRRLPANIREVGQLNPDYPASIQSALQQLAEALENDAPVGAFNPFSPDVDLWEASLKAHEGQTWLHTDWFFAEIAAYRHLIEAVRWWETGRDPFMPKKVAEMGSADLWTALDKALAVRQMSIAERLQALVHIDLWGNRIDLSFTASLAHGHVVGEDDLIADDSVAAVEHILRTDGDVHFIVDNTGTELAMDLALADALFDKGIGRIFFHLKLHPTFVSDTIVADMHIMLAAMQSEERNQETKDLGKRLQTALDEGRLRLAPGAFWNSPYVL
ncbi:MAG: ARMT1-like domain-containing protein, partial [Chloroflexota bacterium]